MSLSTTTTPNPAAATPAAHDEEKPPHDGTNDVASFVVVSSSTTTPVVSTISEAALEGIHITPDASLSSRFFSQEQDVSERNVAKPNKKKRRKICCDIVVNDTKEGSQKMMASMIAATTTAVDAQHQPDRTSTTRSIQTLLINDMRRSKDKIVIEQALRTLGALLRGRNNDIDDHDDEGGDDEADPARQRPDDDEKDLAEFFLCGGHLAVTNVMEQYPDDKGIQQESMIVLMVISHQNSELSNAIGKVDGICCILSAMRRFQSNRCIAMLGFRALANLTAWYDEKNSMFLINDDTTTTSGGDADDAKNGPLRFLVELMMSFQDDVGVSRWACCMFGILSECPRLQKGLVKAKALPSLNQIREIHDGDVHIQEMAGAAIRQLLACHN